jgi:hypothetical protein
VKANKQEQSESAGTSAGTQGAAGGALGSPVTGLVAEVSGSDLLPAMGAGAATKTMSGTSKGYGALSAEALLAGLGEAARRALPKAGGGELSPVLGQVAPAEMAPVVEALPATSQAGAMDDLAPLVETGSSFVEARGTRAATSYGDLVTALGWTTDALTSSVRGSWARD